MMGLWKTRQGELIEALIRVTPISGDYPRIQFEVLKGSSLEDLSHVYGEACMVSVMPKYPYYFYLPLHGLQEGTIHTATIVPRTATIVPRPV